MEINAIGGYKNASYSPIDLALRDAKGDPNSYSYQWAARYTAPIDTGLSKLPNYIGTVYRGVKLPSDELAKYVTGATVTDYAYISTNKDGFHPKYISDGETLFIMESKTGKDITDFPNGAYENEVLFKHDTRFRVEGRSRDGEGRTVIRLLEME